MKRTWTPGSSTETMAKTLKIASGKDYKCAFTETKDSALGVIEALLETTPKL